MEKILVVDDSMTYRGIISSILEDYNLVMAEDGSKAIEKLNKYDDIDIMILDLKMPVMDGFQVLSEVKKERKFKDIPVLILTNVDEIESEIRGLEAGAVDYIRKPINADSLQKRIEVHRDLIRARKEIIRKNEELEERVKYRTKQLELSRKITIDALTGLLEIRDVESSNHTRRTQCIMKLLGEKLLNDSPYSYMLSKEKVEEIYKTCPLHDIGKVGVLDSILLKPGKLTAYEYEEMKKHVKYGVDALIKNIPTEKEIPLVGTALNIIAHHHEKYDGTGYPKGLKREEISLEGRMMGIVDVYDALSGKRVYKDAFSHEKCMDIILSEKGKHFDPVIVEAFESIEEKIIEIIKEYGADDE